VELIAESVAELVWEVMGQRFRAALASVEMPVWDIQRRAVVVAWCYCRQKAVGEVCHQIAPWEDSDSGADPLV
jgi:hypothetical protein